MQYNTIDRMRVPVSSPKNQLFKSQLFTHKPSSNKSHQTQKPGTDSSKNKDQKSIPSFLQTKKSTFLANYDKTTKQPNKDYDMQVYSQIPSPSKFVPRRSTYFPSKDYSSPLKETQNQDKQKGPLKQVQKKSNFNANLSTFSQPVDRQQKSTKNKTGSFINKIQACRSRVDSSSASNKQVFSPLQPKKVFGQIKNPSSFSMSFGQGTKKLAQKDGVKDQLITLKKASQSNNSNSPVNKSNIPTNSQSNLISNMRLLNRKYSIKEQNDIYRPGESKSSLSNSEKVKIPQFLKKVQTKENNLLIPPTLHNQLRQDKKSIERQNKKSENKSYQGKNSSEGEKSYKEHPGSTYYCSQPQSPLQRFSMKQQKSSENFAASSQNNFNKKKYNFLNSDSYVKLIKTPQNYPKKTEFPNFQFGRLSSPSAFNNRKRVQPLAKKEFGLKDFQLVQNIGKGAFGDVYLAQQIQSGFLCVLKKISKKRIRQLQLQEHIVREVKIQAYLKHKHLTSLYGFFDDTQYFYMILELLPDGSLNHVKKNKKIPELETAGYVRQVCQGLKYMHREQIIHRDLKPQNIFLNQNYLKIGDFGCAVYTQTLRKTVVGCLAYISPEQLNNQYYDAKIDVWSIGILTYELVAGKAPFQKDLMKLSKQQAEPQLLKLSFPQNLQISPKCKDFIMRLLEPNPQKRLNIDQAIRHPFLIQGLQEAIKKQKEIFGQYQAL